MPRGGTRHCWSDQHQHRGAGADVSISYPSAPWMLWSLPGTWGGTLAQQEGGKKNHSLLSFAVKERFGGGSQQREA